MVFLNMVNVPFSVLMCSCSYHMQACAQCAVTLEIEKEKQLPQLAQGREGAESRAPEQCAAHGQERTTWVTSKQLRDPTTNEGVGGKKESS